MRRRAILLAVLVLLQALACSQLPPTHYYVLELPDDGTASESRSDGRGEGTAIGVLPLVVDPPYDQTGIVYRIGPDSPEVRFYAYHHWAASLSTMLPEMLARAFAGTPGVGSIEPVLPGREYDALLSGRLMRIEEVDLPSEQRVRLELELRLASDGGEELFSRSLYEETSTTTDQVVEIVELMRSLLAQALATARSDLAAALASR